MRLIDKDALMDEVGVAEDCKDCRRRGLFGCGEDSSFSYACDCITDAPTIDAVPVIRCKDCKHWEKTWTNDWAKDYHYCIMVDGVRKADFYCADAERRNDEHD